MRYLAAFIVIIALSGCDRDKESFRNGTDKGAADSQAVQTPAPSKSETLKVTFSKSDPFDKSSTSKDATPHASASEHAGHGSKEKPSQEKKTGHEEHSKK